MGERERCWEAQRGGGITVAVASGVAIWLHCGSSPSGIYGAQTQEDGYSPSQSLVMYCTFQLSLHLFPINLRLLQGDLNH